MAVIGIPREILPNERRVAATPETVARYVKMGHRVVIESKAGEGIFVTDEDFQKAGAHIVPDPKTLFEQADVVLKVKQPIYNTALGAHEVALMKAGTILVTFLHPAAPECHEMVRMLRDRNISAFTMDGVPRISKAQRVDALSSMSTVTGYRAMIIAASLLPKFIPMMTTAIGMIKPANVLVIGAGVVGLQAIATAKRLGGVTKVVDIRKDANEQAASVGAKIAGFDIPEELAVAPGGYAKALDAEWIKKERDALTPLVSESDIVILCALVFGEVAPVLITREMVSAMKPGSVIVDVSIDQGGNCEVTQPGEISVTTNGVTICGTQNIPGGMAVHSSWLYANNLCNYVEMLFHKDTRTLNMDDEIVRESMVTHQGQIVFQTALKAMNEV